MRCQCQSQAGRTWRTDGTTKELGKPLLISAWSSAETSWMYVYLYVCVGWKPAAEWSWDVKDDTCAGDGVCGHCQRGCDWSTSPLALISVSMPPFLLFLTGGQLLRAPSHSGAVSGWPLRNILGVFLECSVSHQRAVEEVIIMVKDPGQWFKPSVSQYLRYTPPLSLSLFSLSLSLYIYIYIEREREKRESLYIFLCLILHKLYWHLVDWM